MIYRYFFIFLFLCVGCFPVYAQKANKKSPAFTPTEIWGSGLPFIQNFTSDDYKGNPQNWAFIEGDDGLMYIGNGIGVIEYDGNSWRPIYLANNSVVRSLAKSKDGKIYVGANGEFGYLQKDSIGNTQYRSLSAKLGKAYSKFTDIWSIVTLNNSVFFASADFLIRWDGTELKVWKPKEHFGRVYKVHQKVYIISKGVGILAVQGEDLNLISNGDYFNDFEGAISMMQPLGSDKILLGHRSKGLFVYDDGKISVFNNKIQNKFQQKKISSATILMNGDYAVATINSGVYILNGTTGDMVGRYGMEQGLSGDTFFAIYNAPDGAIWLGGDNGISRINIMMPIRKFNKVNGITERVRSVTYDGNTLFVGSNGVSYLENSTPSESFSTPEFRKIKRVEENVRSIVQVASHKLVLQGAMVFDLNKDNVAKLIIEEDGGIFRYALKSNVYSNTVYISSYSGTLYQFNLTKDKWKSKIIAKLQEGIVKITEEPNGDLWLSTFYNGVYKFKTTNDTIIKDSLYPLRHYDTIAGLPSMTYNFIFHLDKKLYALNHEYGLYKFDKISQFFSKDTMLMNQYDAESAGDYIIYGTFGTNKGDVWQTVGSEDGNKIYKLKGNQISELPGSNLFNDFATFNIYAADSILFFSGPKGIIAYNQHIKIPKSKLNAVQLRKVFIKNDSLVYAGKNATSEYSFPYKQNALQFEYSLPYYTKSAKNEYQYILEGFDQDWSKWSLETKNNYTNIPEGTYTFKVRAKNIFGEISKEDSYVFTILPPWYRTWWAYLVYFLGAVLTIVLFSQWRSKKLRAKNLALEKIVTNRTEEISEKNTQLESQTERLKELDTMKTRLFANISHEFRTPLTLIKGPIEKLEETQKNIISTTNIKMIRRNANRLLNLVNQLLDLSKLDSGKLQLNVAEGDVFKCVRTAASAFGSHAASRNIDYQIKIPSRPLWGSFDRDKLEKIMYNLLSNAFKFTTDEGKISIIASFRHNQLELKVSDTGSGIAAEKLPYIYDRFFQVDDSYTREKAGSGIGLALTKELVQLMKGEIYVESELGKGTRFKVLMGIEEIKSYQKEEMLEQEASIPVFEDTDGEVAQAISYEKRTNILIIEDNNDMRHFIAEQLAEEYNIFEAPNGKEGLKKATELMPDLIITDLMMPQMDGITLCKKLKTNLATSHIPVIMLTAKAGIENKLEGLETGADVYLTKPFNAKELQVQTKNLIAQRQHLRELFSKNLTLDPQEITITSLDEKFLQQLLDLLEEKHSDAEFGVPQMQKHLGMGKTQLHTKTKALTDQPPGELLRNFRLKRAAQLLLQNAENISQVAYSVGFNSLSYFTRCFKEYYGMSPSKFIKKDSSNT